LRGHGHRKQIRELAADLAGVEELVLAQESAGTSVRDEPPFAKNVLASSGSYRGASCMS
jgi:hypothetical protein